MAVNIRKFVLQAHSPRRARRARHDHRAGGPLPRGGGRGRAQHPGLRRHPGRQDDAAQLPVRGHPGAGAGDHLRGGLRAPGAAARRRLDADPPAQPRGRRGDPAAPPGQGGAADAALPDRRRRGAPGGVPRPADRAELRPARHVHAARQQRPRGRGEDVHPAAAGRGEHRDGVRRPDRGVQRRPRRARRHRRRPGSGGCARSSRCPAAPRAASSRPPTSSPPATAGWSGPTAIRRTPTGSPRWASTWPALLGRRPVTESGALLGLLLGVGLLLIWRSGPRAPQPRTGPRRPGRRQQLLAEAGLTGINAAQLLALQVGLGLLVAGRRPADHRHGDGQPGVRRVRVRAAVRAGAAAGRQAAGRPARGVAGGRRQPGLGRPGRAVAARGAVGARRRAGPRCCGRRSPGSPPTTGPAAGSAPCLDRLKDDLADPVGDRIVETLRVAREVGGSDLGRVLRTLADLPPRGRPRPRGAGDPAGLGGLRPRGWRSPRRGSCCSCWPRSRRRWPPTTPRSGRRSCSAAARSACVAYRLMLRIGRLPEDVRVLQ